MATSAAAPPAALPRLARPEMPRPPRSLWHRLGLWGPHRHPPPAPHTEPAADAEGFGFRGLPYNNFIEARSPFRCLGERPESAGLGAAGLPQDGAGDGDEDPILMQERTERIKRGRTTDDRGSLAPASLPRR